MCVFYILSAVASYMYYRADNTKNRYTVLDTVQLDNGEVFKASQASVRGAGRGGGRGAKRHMCRSNERAAICYSKIS